MTNRIALNAGWDLEMLNLELQELSVMGADLEALCAAKAAQRITDDDAAQLRELAASLERSVAEANHLRYSELNRELHRWVVGISGRAAGGQRRARRLRTGAHHVAGRGAAARHGERRARPFARRPDGPPAVGPAAVGPAN